MKTRTVLLVAGVSAAALYLLTRKASAAPSTWVTADSLPKPHVSYGPAINSSSSSTAPNDKTPSDPDAPLNANPADFAGAGHVDDSALDANPLDFINSTGDGTF